VDYVFQFVQRVLVIEPNQLMLGVVAWVQWRLGRCDCVVFVTVMVMVIVVVSAFVIV
jgi:hypothetical protein